MTTTMQSRAYKQLVTLARRLGGDVVAKSDIEIDRLHRGDWSVAPFCIDIGVYWRKKIIIHRTSGFTTAGLVHEMGHVFACRYHPNHNKCEETDFLGWEVMLARRVGIYGTWLKEMKDYGLHDEENHFVEIGSLDKPERDHLFAQHILKAQKLGSLGPRGEIRTIRN